MLELEELGKVIRIFSSEFKVQGCSQPIRNSMWDAMEQLGTFDRNDRNCPDFFNILQQGGLYEDFKAQDTITFVANDEISDHWLEMFRIADGTIRVDAQVQYDEMMTGTHIFEQRKTDWHIMVAAMKDKELVKFPEHFAVHIWW